MKFLPDTNIIVRGLKGDEPEAEFLKEKTIKNQLVVSVVVIGEFYGKGNIPDQEIKAFEEFATTFKYLLVDEAVAKQAGLYRSQFLRKSKRVFLLDCFLAAQAKLNKLTLVTNNRADFPMKDIKIISP